jgi:hypothetical protein
MSLAWSRAWLFSALTEPSRIGDGVPPSVLISDATSAAARVCMPVKTDLWPADGRPLPSLRRSDVVNEKGGASSRVCAVSLLAPASASAQQLESEHYSCTESFLLSAEVCATRSTSRSWTPRPTRAFGVWCSAAGGRPRYYE